MHIGAIEVLSIQVQLLQKGLISNVHSSNIKKWIHTLAVAGSPLTLYPPRLFTTQVNVASLPWAIVTFSNGTRKSGSNPDTATTNTSRARTAAILYLHQQQIERVCTVHYTYVSMYVCMFACRISGFKYRGWSQEGYTLYETLDNNNTTCKLLWSYHEFNIYDSLKPFKIIQPFKLYNTTDAKNINEIISWIQNNSHYNVND